MKKIWSIILTLVMVLSLMPAGALTLTANAGTEQPSEYYTGTLAATVAGTHTKNGETIVSEAIVMTAEDAFVPGISADWVKFSTHDVAGFNSIVGAHFATPVTGLTPTAGDAVLLYVKLPANTPATQMGIRIQNMTANRDLLADGKVYLLPSGADAWLEKTATIATEKVAGGTMKGVGYFDVPANFEGWVRVPMTSIALDEDVALKSVRVFMLNVDAAYAADYLGIGAISVIDNADKDYMHLTTDGGNTFVDLVGSKADDEEDKEDVEQPSEYYTGTLAATVAGTHTKNGETIVNEATVMTAEDAFVPGVSADWVKFTLLDVDAFNTIVGAHFASPVTGLTPTAGDAVLLYVKLPANTPATQMGIRIQNMTANRDLLADGKVYLLPSGADAWLEKTATIATEKVAGGTMKGVGYFDVPANFEGWVRVPMTSIALDEDVALKSVRVFMLNIGDSYRTDYLGVGAFTVINNADKDYMHLTTDGGNTFVKLNAEKAACDHVYDNACDANCNNCSAEREVPDHVYDNACDAFCNECNAEREVPDHVYDNACDANCNECGAVREVAEHVYDNACDADCNECSAEREVPDHVYDNACDAFCNECDANRKVPDHVYDDENDHVCNICGHDRLVASTPGDVNGDDIVNNKDLGLVQRKINSWDVEIDVDAADINGDGIINNKDLGLLQRIINDWDAELQ